MKKSKTLLTFLLIASLVLTSMPGNFVFADELLSMGNISCDENVSLENNYNKIHFYTGTEEYTTIDTAEELAKAKQELDSNEANAVTYALNDDSNNTEMQNLMLTIQFASDFKQTDGYRNYKEAKKNVKSIEELRELRKEFTDYSKVYHQELIEKNLSLLDGIEYDSIKRIGYSSIVVLNTNANNIETVALSNLCESSMIEHISVGYELTTHTADDIIGDTTVAPMASWNLSMECVNAYEIVNNSGYNGRLLRIGVLDPGICDTTHPALSDIRIIKDTRYPDKAWESLYNTAEIEALINHATAVTAILATMAPEAQFFCSSTAYGGDLEWFIDVGVDVVNCSFGNVYDYDNGIYTYIAGDYRYDYDGIYDYQIEANDMIVVVSSGNYCNDPTSKKYNPDRKVACPGNAYNAITVGGVDLRYTTSNGTNTIRYYHEPDACYVTNDSTRVKPNISAPYEVSVPNYGYFSGTSCSAPIVTGCIALLIEASDFYYAWEPEAIMAVITSTAKETEDYSATQGYFDDKVGAGIIDLEDMIAAELPECYTQHNVAMGNNPALVYSLVVDLPENATVTISVAWLTKFARVFGTDDSVVDGISYFTNYDLEIVDGEYMVSSTCLVASSLLDNSNVELVRFTANAGGTYTILLWQMHQIPGESLQDQVSISILY